MTSSQYKARLLVKGHGVPVSPIRGTPILLDVGKLASEGDTAFIRWLHKARRLNCINALRASTDKAEVRLERKLRLLLRQIEGQWAVAGSVLITLHSGCADSCEHIGLWVVDPPTAHISGENREW